jgi:hypothetical protein
MISLALLAILGQVPQVAPRELQVLNHLSFDDLLPPSKPSAVVGWQLRESGGALLIEGGVVAVPGLSGAALRFDGITGRCELLRAFSATEFTFEAWIALSAYPPAWCTLASQWRDEQGWRIDLGPEGQLRFEVAGEKAPMTCGTNRPFPIGSWTHLAAVFGTDLIPRLYVNGQERGGGVRRKLAPRLAPDEPLRIGSPSPYWFEMDPDERGDNRAAWADPGFGLDGVVDEVRILRGGMTRDEALRRFESSAASDPPLSERCLPDGPTGPGVFGAIACALPYYPGWDALRSDGAAPDVVVRFDSTEARFVFWGGLFHEPLWVTQDGMRALLKVPGMLIGAYDPFLQRPDNISSSARIHSSNAARVIVHCRRPSSPKPIDSPDEPHWIDDVLTIYPDACGVRRTTGLAWRDYPGTALRCVWEPGQDPCDLLNVDFLALAGLEGKTTVATLGNEYHSYDWESSPGDGIGIQWLNLESDAKPFLAAQIQSARVHQHESAVLDEVPKQEMGGRYNEKEFRWALGGGVGPFMLPGGADFWLKESRVDGGERNFEMLFGMRAEGMDKLQPLARGWARPPELVLASPDWRSLGWDRSQRAWRIERAAWISELAFRIEASEASPMVRPAIVVHGWGERAVELSVDGALAPEGERLRQGLERQLGPTDLVVWLDVSSTQPVDITIRPQE